MKSFLTKCLFILLLLSISISCKRPIDTIEDKTTNNTSINNKPKLEPKESVLDEIIHPIESKKVNFESPKISKTDGLTIVTWNIRHLGRTKTDDDIYQIANLLRDFDIVAIQEVVAKDPAGAQAVAKIADELNRMGAQWDYQISDPTKSPTPQHSERYAFLWKPSKVNIVHRAYLDQELEDICYREPFIAKFRSKNKDDDFYIINYHSRKYTDKPEEEIIHFIDYPERLNSDRIIIAGDFNLSETHDVWRPIYRKGFDNAISSQKTTLKTKCKDGDYLSHPIDNIYFTSGILKVQAESIDFIKECENLQRAREISDHLPVYMQFRIQL